MDNSDENSTKRRRTCTEDLDNEHIDNDEESKAAADNSEEKSGNFWQILLEFFLGLG